jgi:transposase
VDECGFSQRPNVRRTWAPKGQTPVIPGNYNWKRLSASGGVAWRPDQDYTRLFLSLRPGALATEDAVEFLRNLRRHLRGPVVVIWDGLPAHRSRAVAAFAKTQSHWLRLERLPAYAPELNPVEYFWANLKNGATANYAPDYLSELEEHLQGATRRLRRRDHIGLGYIKHAGLLAEADYVQLCEGQ